MQDPPKFEQCEMICLFLYCITLLFFYFSPHWGSEDIAWNFSTLIVSPPVHMLRFSFVVFLLLFFFFFLLLLLLLFFFFLFLSYHLSFFYSYPLPHLGSPAFLSHRIIWYDWEFSSLRINVLLKISVSSFLSHCSHGANALWFFVFLFRSLRI